AQSGAMPTDLSPGRSRLACWGALRVRRACASLAATAPELPEPRRARVRRQPASGSAEHRLHAPELGGISPTSTAVQSVRRGWGGNWFLGRRPFDVIILKSPVHTRNKIEIDGLFSFYLRATDKTIILSWIAFLLIDIEE